MIRADDGGTHLEEPLDQLHGLNVRHSTQDGPPEPVPRRAWLPAPGERLQGGRDAGLKDRVGQLAGQGDPGLPLLGALDRRGDDGRLRHADPGEGRADRPSVRFWEGREHPPDGQAFLGRAPGGQPQDLSEVGLLALIGRVVVAADDPPVALSVDLPGELAHEHPVGLDAGPEGFEGEMHRLGAAGGRELGEEPGAPARGQACQKRARSLWARWSAMIATDAMGATLASVTPRAVVGGLHEGLVARHVDLERLKDPARLGGLLAEIPDEYVQPLPDELEPLQKGCVQGKGDPALGRFQGAQRPVEAVMLALPGPLAFPT